MLLVAMMRQSDGYSLTDGAKPLSQLAASVVGPLMPYQSVGLARHLAAGQPGTADRCWLAAPTGVPPAPTAASWLLPVRIFFGGEKAVSPKPVVQSTGRGGYG